MRPRLRGDSYQCSGAVVPQVVRWLASLAFLVLIGLTFVPSAARSMREWLLVRSPAALESRHLSYAQADARERDEFLRDRSEVEVVVPWDMTAEELLNLYSLRNHPRAVAEVIAWAGGLNAPLSEGKTFHFLLN